MIFFGNLVYYLYWPFLFIQTLFKKLRHKRTWNLLVAFTLITIVINPLTAKYGFVFLLFTLFRLKFPKIYTSNFFLFLILTSCILIEFVPKNLLFNPLDSGFRLLRYKAFFTEPAYLGYWSAFAGYESLVSRKYWKAAIFISLLFFSTSVGAFIYFFLSLIANKSRKIHLFAILFLILSLLIFQDQFFSKISDDSLSRVYRIQNFLLAWEYVLDNFGIPKGFGPIVINSDEIGVMSGLLYIKAFGVLIIPLIIIIRFKVTRFIAASFIFLMVGNFWETPLLWHLKKK